MMRRHKRRRLKFIGAGVVAASLVAFAIVLAFSQDRSEPVVSPVVSSYWAAQATATPTAAPKFKAIPAGSSVLIVGDSFTEGYGADNEKEQGYAYLLAKATGWNATIAGAGGTGFTWGGGKDGSAGDTYLERLKMLAATDIKPEMVILQGGSNDYRADSSAIVAATRETVTFVRQTWPDAQVLVIAPMPVQPHGNNLRNVANPMSRGAIGTAAYFIDPNKLGWLTKANTPLYAFTDGAHVNTAGHAYLASKIEETLDAYAAD